MSAISKVNSSGLSLNEKNSLKLIMQKNLVLRDQIAEDDTVDDVLLRVYLNGMTKPLTYMEIQSHLDGLLQWLFRSPNVREANSASADTDLPPSILSSTLKKEEKSPFCGFNSSRLPSDFCAACSPPHSRIHSTTQPNTYEASPTSASAASTPSLYPNTYERAYQSPNSTFDAIPLASPEQHLRRRNRNFINNKNV